MKPNKKTSYRYLLGDSPQEAARLRRQGRLWDPIAHELFDRLGVRKNWKVLEIGPGRGSLHLELRSRVRGPVDFVERSDVFAAHIKTLCLRDRLGPGRLWQTDLLAADLPANHYDLIFARWVFLFLPDPAAHIRKLVRALKPGGRLALQDYHRETLAMAPRPPEWDDFMRADRAFFATQGGDVSIGGRLPTLFTQAGLRVTDIKAHVKTGHPGSDVWKWLSDYFLGVLPRYAELPPLSPAKAARLRGHWLKAQRQATSVMIGPALLDVVGRK